MSFQEKKLFLITFLIDKFSNGISKKKIFLITLKFHFFNYVSIFQWFISFQKKLIQFQITFFNGSCLLKAVHSGSVDVVKFLLNQQEIDVNVEGIFHIF